MNTDIIPTTPIISGVAPIIGAESKPKMSLMLLEPLSKATQEVMEPLRLSPDTSLEEYIYLHLDKKGNKFIAEIRTKWQGEWKQMHPSFYVRQFWNRIPEKEWLGQKDYKKENQYRLGATDFTALVISASWPSDRIIFQKPDGTEDTLAKLHFDYLIQRFTLQEFRAQMSAEFKVTGKIPEMPDDWVDHPIRPLSGYQKVGCLMSLGQESCAYFADKGIGKTPMFIQRMCMEGIRKRRDENKMLRALLVVPQQVLLNWQEEIQNFAITNGKVVIAKGTLEQRAKAIIEGVTAEDGCNFSAIVISYDSCVATIEMLEQLDWDIICCDESHMFKSSRTERWKALKRLREKSTYRVVMTGTPIGNIFLDLWTQLEFLGDGLSGFQDLSAFKNFHGEWENIMNTAGVQRLLAMKHTALLHERLARLSFAVTKTEAGLNLPDKVYDIYQVEMTAKQADIYRQVAAQIAVEIENELSGETNALTVEHILTRLLRLEQITSGFVTWDPILDDRTGVVLKQKRIEQISADNPKVMGLVDMLTEEGRDPLGKTIVWAYFVEDIQTIGKKLTQLGIKHGCYYGQTDQNKRDELVTAFNCDPKFKVLVANPQTAGEGLNLLGYDKRNPESSNTYCDHEIFFSQNWSAILRSQAEDRAHRRGTRMPVRITDLMVPGTIDQEIRRRVQMKQSMAFEVTDIREILKGMVNG